MSENLIKKILTQDAGSLLKFYKREIEVDQVELEQHQKRVYALQKKIQNRLEIIEELERGNFPNTSDSEKITYKWTIEVDNFFTKTSMPSSTTAISDFLIERDKINNVEFIKEIKNKISITCSGLFRSGKLLRRKLPNGEYEYLTNEIYRQINEDLPF